MEDDASPKSGLDEWRASIRRPDGAEAQMSATEVAMRRLATRKEPYRGEIIGLTRGWVSRDGRMHMFAARYLDFTMLTPEHLIFCSTGFFSRRPHRLVLREPLNRIVVVPFGAEPIRTVRIHGDFDRPLVLELRSDPESLAFAAELLARTRADDDAPAPTPADEPTTA